MSTTNPTTTTAIIEKTVDNLRIDAAYMRMTSRDQTNAEDAQALASAALKVRRLSDALERLKRAFERKETTAGLGL
jgi:hypothetical protein